MSEYQYYEFLAIDRRLTANDQAELRSLSSRAEVTVSRAVYTYSYSDFPADPRVVLEKYFDALLYITNWGTRLLIFKFPRELFIEDDVSEFVNNEQIGFGLSEDGKHAFLELDFSEDGYEGWVDEDDYNLADYAEVRNEILKGDYRSLYIAWLATIQGYEIMSDDEDDFGPPVPAGLKSLTLAQIKFQEFLESDQDLLEAASQNSRPPDLKRYSDTSIALMADEEKDAFLKRLSGNETHLSVKLNRRLAELAGSSSESATTQSSSIAELLRTAKQIEVARLEKEQKERLAEKIKALKSLSLRRDDEWKEVIELIEKKHGTAYGQAVKKLVALKELAEFENRQDEFLRKMSQLMSQYSNRPALMNRFHKANLKSGQGPLYN